jgi:hypothetical protein
MHKRILFVALAAVVGLTSGCTDVSQNDPKPVGTPDTRLKPIEAGGNKAAAQQPSVKGD